ncbi:hypothetical protein CUMW_218480 [Citrus unshiu]|uniref:AAA+ ATPase domain-containing protein n=1 Tax=Citrus unshiu TaxID=55188 RepID=A0A2H5QD57_CITUN|nr:hypothetical protein CUMW_218480 [Citrus unshiu]
MIIFKGMRFMRMSLNSIEEFIKGVAKSIIDDEARAKMFCFKGLCPNLISRYKLSKKAATAAEDAANLLRKGNFSSVSYHPAPDRAELRDVKDYEIFDSRKEIFQVVMESLKDDKLKVIGVYGMGGVGKTTLVKQVAMKVMEDKLFDKVVMAEVTQTPDYRKIEDQFAFDLGMKLDLNDSTLERTDGLRKRLNKEMRVLIILDNIWTKLEKDDQERCTIVLISRSRDLLCNDMNSQKDFWIDGSTRISAYQPTEHEIVERRGGLPVAPSTIANALKSKSVAIWKDALNQLKSPSLKEIHGMDADS